MCALLHVGPHLYLLMVSAWKNTVMLVAAVQERYKKSNFVALKLSYSVHIHTYSYV